LAAPKQVILIGVDGWHHDHFMSMLTAGSLPNFQRVLNTGGWVGTARITGHDNTVTAAGNAELHSGLPDSITGVYENECGVRIPAGKTVFERLKAFDPAIYTGSIYGKETGTPDNPCYIPETILTNAKNAGAIDWWQSKYTYASTSWPDYNGVCDNSIHVAQKALEFIQSHADDPFYLVVYFGVPDCSGHAYSEDDPHYDAAIINVNAGLGVILDELERLGIRNDTQIIMTGDHGWNTGTNDHSVANDDTLTLPLVATNQNFVSTVPASGRKQCDISATTLNYFGMTAPGYQDITNVGCSSMLGSIVPPEGLSVSPSAGLSSSGFEGGPFSPESVTYSVQNTGGTTISWAAANSQAWVTLSSIGGTLTSGQSATVTVSISGSAAGLGAGSYIDAVIFANTTNGIGDTTRSVDLVVSALPINGACGASSDGTFTAAPTTDLCSTGNATAAIGAGPWTWSCTGMNGGTTANCSANIQTYTVSTSAGTGGMIAPASWLVSHGSTTTFTITPDTGYSINAVTGCGGSLSGDTYTTGPITAVCTVTASFALGTAAPGTPTLKSPALSSEVTTNTPVISVNASSDPHGVPVSYIIEVYADSNLTTLVTSTTTEATSWTVAPALMDNALFFWRALATDGMLKSNWMSTADFIVNTANDTPSSPAVSSPVNNTHIASLTPVLSVSNATDMDMYDTLTYDFEVATDGGFATVVASTSGISQGGGGITSWTIGPSLTEYTTYYWRARSRDDHGAVSSWISASFFVNTTNSAPTAPTVNAPASASEVAVFTPSLTVNNASDADLDMLHYVFEIDTVNSFNSVDKRTSGLLSETANTTSWTPSALNENTMYYWRAKASDGLTDGPWMATARFLVNSVNEAPTAPTLNNPPDGAQVTALGPTLQIHAATDPDQDVLTYEFQVYSDSDLVNLVTDATGAGASWFVERMLTDNTLYWWRARARDEHGLAGNWMAATSFFMNKYGYNDPPTITITKPAAAEPWFSNDAYTVQWTTADPDSTAAISLGYDTTGSGCQGAQIVTGLTEHDGQDSYRWDITNLEQGTYYIYATIGDGTTTNCTYGAGPLTKSDASGDITGDGIVDMTDALRSLQIAAGLIQPSVADAAHADVAPLVNGKPHPDGIIDIRDVVVILRKAVGLVVW
jgi:hypothetical protein